TLTELMKTISTPLFWFVAFGAHLDTPTERRRSPPEARCSVDVVWSIPEPFTSYAAADRASAAPKWLRPRRRDGPRSGCGGFKNRPDSCAFLWPSNAGLRLNGSLT